MQLNIAFIMKNEGAKQAFSGSFPLGEFVFSGDTLSFEQPLAVVGEMRNIGGTVEIEAQIEGDFTTCCARCGDVVRMHLETELHESLSEEDEASLDEECLTLSGNLLDIDGALRAAIFGAIPLRFLCREDCKGLCSVCGANLNQTVCNCDPEL